MTYRALSKRRGYPETVTRAELLRSPHREVRQAAAHMRAVVVNGVKYLPTIENRPVGTQTVGRSRVNSLPGFEVPSAESLAIARRTIDDRTKSVAGRSPTPAHIEDLTDFACVETVGATTTVLVPRRQFRPYLAVAAALWIASVLGLGYAVYRSAQTGPQYAAPFVDRRGGL